MRSKRTDDGLGFLLIGIGIVLLCLVLLPLYVVSVAWQTRSSVLFALVGAFSLLVLLAMLTQSGVFIVLAIAGLLVLVIIAHSEDNRNTPSDSGRPPLPFDVF